MIEPSTPITIVWFRRDLRLEDNPALTWAAERGAVLPVYLHTPDDDAPWAPGAASRLWLHLSLERLAERLEHAGTVLLIREGRAHETLVSLVREAGASAVVWNRGYEPAQVARDTELKRDLRERGVETHSFNANLLNEPARIQNRQGQPFRVFTPYYRHCVRLGPPSPPIRAPSKLVAPAARPVGVELDTLALLPTVRWDAGIRASWTPGRAGAERELDTFADAAVLEYGSQRDRPDRVGVSRLSPHLHFGEISPREVWHTIADRHRAGGELGVDADAEPFLRQLYWREFAHSLLYHFPHTADRSLNERFERFPWLDGETDGAAALTAWQHGLTGYPLVDAGMRELWHTGWMHNRVRMNVASFLVKHLLIHWRHGARWFFDTLVDADLANNTMGWQWAAGCGADAAPYFRIFNPVLQGQRFDPAGAYVKRWVPELARLPEKLVHCPWQASEAQRREAGVVLGESYPAPIVEHREARQRALDALAASAS